MATILQARNIADFQVGDSFEESRLISDELVRGFAELSGDRNPIHLDEEYAASTRFGGRIAHGALLLALVSKVLGMDLPGLGAVYLSQQIEFLAPVRVGERLSILVQVEAIDPDARVVSLSNQLRVLAPEGQIRIVASGTSRIKLPRAS